MRMKAFGNIGWILGTALLLSVDCASGQTLTNLRSFSDGDGSFPYGGLVQGHDGNFYGTTMWGGTSGSGSVFRISSSGSFTTMHSFSGPDGDSPIGGLVQGSDSNFYGTTWYGGASNLGTVFRINPSGSFTNLYSFSGSDGTSPNKLLQAIDSNFYGTTAGGGTRNSGTVFRISTGGAFSNLYSFSQSDGADPYAGLVQGSDSNFYGSTRLGGISKGGVIFRINASGILTNLHTFLGSEGARPVGELVQGGDGNFYGTTSAGGIGNNGTVFRISPNGIITNLHSFVGSDGANSANPLIVGSDGAFYGTANQGGASSKGTIFRIRPDGTFTNLYSFGGSDGNDPQGGLVQGSDGNFYGVTSLGGNLFLDSGFGEGVVFKFSVPPDPGPIIYGPVFFVTNNSDGGAGSLRQVISDATTNGGGTILFSNVTGMITLTGGVIFLSTNLTIDTWGVPGGITVNGNHSSRIFWVTHGNTVVLNGLVITNGYNSGGDAGGVVNLGTLTLNRCTLSGNICLDAGDGGAAILNNGNLTVNECTFAGNFTDEYGGGIENLASLTVNQCTFTQNNADQGGGAIDQFGNGTSLTLTGSILAGDTAAHNAPDLFMENGVLSASYCLIGDGTGSTVVNGVNGNLVGTTAVPIDPLLGPLGDYGGPTPTMVLTRGSPAIDAGGSTTFSTDQRGYPRSVGLAPDIGAYESGTRTNYNVWIWELLPNSATVDQHAGPFDFDGDGQSNTNEWLTGTDPGDASSAFRITAITRQGNDLRVTWMMGSGKTNALQATPGAGNGSYQTNSFANLFTVTNTVGTTTNFLDVGGATNKLARYFRVRLVP